MVDLVEFYLSKAELLYSRGEIEQSIQAANIALSQRPIREREIALKLFIARAKSGLNLFEESNTIYRSLIDENVYLPPVILGILHNNLNLSKDDKTQQNIGLMRIFI